ncbi:MAG TPA: hypothetical protein VMS77_08020 [Conexivisphaerales archaeon]|nr:hypothetical protein [Conexivisphaerales archaeon]
MSDLSRLGFWSAVLTCIFAAAALALGVFTPPLPSGCTNCTVYPYTGAASLFPAVSPFMYPASLMVLTFAVLMACVYEGAPGDRRIYGLVALCFALTCATVIAADYFIQLAVVQPSILKGETEGLSLIILFNPHGVGIALEDLGYLMMSLSFLFAGMVFMGRSRLERAIRVIFTGSSLLAIAALVILSLLYGANLEDKFEVAVITVTWTALIISGALLGMFYRRLGSSVAPTS